MTDEGITKDEIIKQVAKRLRKYRRQGAPLHIVDAGVEQKEGWWYVPISPEDPIKKPWPYYEFLTDIEEEFEDEAGVDLLLVPVAARAVSA